MAPESAGPTTSVVITGAASGIGRAVVRRLLADGHGVVAVDVARQQLDDLVRDAQDRGCPVIGVLGDVTDRHTHHRAVVAARAFGPMAAWVGCAGITRGGPLTELTDSEVRLIVETNQFGLLWGAAEAVTEWTTSGMGGVLIAISSVHARRAGTHHAVYEMTKAAAEALIRSVAVNYGSVGIRAVAVAPGAIDTPPLRASLQAAADPGMARQRLVVQSPANRLGDPSEVASVVSFLLSPDARYVSGISLPVDGGWTSALVNHTITRSDGPDSADSEGCT